MSEAVSDPPRRSVSDAVRRRDLARMRALATGLLLAMTGLFVATRFAPQAWLWPAYVGAFAEAAMVGALADWFAVTALFRRPLGLPIPHTAIIPRNKDRIGDALGDFIAGNFLTPSVLEQRLRRIEPSRRIAEWLATPANVEMLARRLGALAPRLSPTGGEWRGLALAFIRRAAGSRPLAPTAGRILDWLWREPAVQRGFNRLIESLGSYLTAREAFIQTRLAGASWRWAPKWLDRMLAEKFTRGLLGAIEGLDDPDHPWRAELAGLVEGFIVRLGSDPDLIDKGERLKARLLADPELPARFDALIALLADRLGGESTALEDLITDVTLRILRALGQWLAEDAAARDGVDRWMLVALRRTVSAQRHAIGGFVGQVVRGWDAAEVAERLELQVGRDLQYIRINGAIVGGLAGLLIFTLTRWLS